MPFSGEDLAVDHPPNCPQFAETMYPLFGKRSVSAAIRGSPRRLVVQRMRAGHLTY